MRRTQRIQGLLGLGLVVIATGLVWLFLRASADVVPTTNTAAPLPRSGIVQSVNGNVVTLKGATEEMMTVVIDEQTIIRRADQTGSFAPILAAEIREGQLAVITAEIAGQIGAIDLIELGGAQ